MCFTNVNEAGIRYRYFMYSTNKCTDFNKNMNIKKEKKYIYIYIYNLCGSAQNEWKDSLKARHFPATKSRHINYIFTVNSLILYI